jgi:subtilisin family serine protease
MSKINIVCGRGFLLALCSILVVSCQKSIDLSSNIEAVPIAAESAAKVSPRGEYVPGEVIVKFKEGIAAKGVTVALSLIGGAIKEQIYTPSSQAKGQGMAVFLLTTSLQVEKAIAILEQNDRVDYAEPNFLYQHQATSNDTYFTNNSLWGMYGANIVPSNQFGSQASIAWANGKIGSSNVYVGIIDEGVMFNHIELASNFWLNPFDPVDGIDNDGNGYRDDIRGWDFEANNNSVFDGAGDDHGTHVAGTIGAVGGNGTGVAGVCWNVKLISAKFLGSRGGTTANAIKAVDYFTDLKNRHGLNVVATNNSWGGGGFSQALYDAIERANAAGILFIAAAGNDALGSASYPAAYANTNIIGVASITSTGALSSFSNYNSVTVDIGAPGSGIWSTIPVSSRGKIISGYASYNGTSMATPHVTGAAALYKSIYPTATAAQVRAAILSSATPTLSLAGRTVTGGRLNVSTY